MLINIPYPFSKNLVLKYKEEKDLEKEDGKAKYPSLNL